MMLTGAAASRLAAMVPAGQEAVIHLAITDDHPMAQAFVVIEAVASQASLSSPRAAPPPPPDPR